MRRLLAVAAVVAVLVVPSAARAYPNGGCAAPENWPPQTADIYLRTCGVSLSDALANKQAPTAPASVPAKRTGSAATPVAAGIGLAGVAAGFAVAAHRRRK